MLLCLRCGAHSVGAYGVCSACGAEPRAELESPRPGAVRARRRDVRLLGRALTVLLAVNVATLGLLAAAEIHRHLVVDRVIARIDATDMLRSLAPDPFATAALTAAAGAFLLAGLLTVCWLFLARSNAETYGGYTFELGRAWAVAGWFTPVAAWFVPLRVVRETHRGTVAENRPGRAARRPGGAVTGWWWGTWLAGGAAISAALQDYAKKSGDLYDGMASLHAVQSLTLRVVPGLGLWMAAAVLLLVHVREITRIQTARAAEPSGGPVPPPFDVEG